MSDFDAELGAAAESEEQAAAERFHARQEERVAHRDRRIRALEREVRDLTRERDELAERRDNFFTQFEAMEVQPPRWMQPKKSSKSKRRATVFLMLSDLHLDEVVRPEEMNFVNAYNRKIAEQRFARVIEWTCRIKTEMFAWPSYDGITILADGDIFSGWLHDLQETNEDSPLGSLAYWSPIFAGALSHLADVYGKVHIVWEWGNHGRLTMKPKTKGFARDNTEWLFAHMVQQSLASDKRISHVIPEALDILIPIYDTTIRMEHGNEGFKGGSGIAGALSPMMLGVHRATRQAQWENRNFDVMAIGHWHSEMYLPSRGLIANGSLKGYDEYARTRLKTEPELAKQSLFIITPEHGISFSAPAIATDRKKEGW